MAEPARDPEVERRIREHVEAIDSALAARGVPPAERRSVTGDVEIQIRDMLATTAGGAPTLADVEAVLRRLDPPESYANQAETEGIEAGRISTPAEPPRFSRTAIFGAVWGSMVFVALAIGLCTGGGYHGTVASLRWWLKIPVIILLTLYVTAPFGATILGWVAVSQIRRSKGRLYGMGLALASGLFYPLLALDAVMTVAIWYPVAGIAEWLLPNVNTHPLRYFFFAFDLLSAGALCAFVDYRVVRWTWGKISAPIRS